MRSPRLSIESKVLDVNRPVTCQSWVQHLQAADCEDHQRIIPHTASHGVLGVVPVRFSFLTGRRKSKKQYLTLGPSLAQHDALEQQAREWGRLGDLAARRLPAWERLCALLKHAATISEAEGLRAQANAIKMERRVLDPSDPVPDVRKAAADMLRSALNEAHVAYTTAHNERMAELVKTEAWTRLNEDQREQILAAEGIDEIPSLSIGSEDDLLRTLEETPLSVWKTKTDALSQQFDRAAIAAAKLLEPKTQRVHLASGTLRNEQQVKAWIAETELDLLARLHDGPIVIS